MKKTWGIIVLIVWCLWTVSRDVMSLFPSADSVDRAVYEANGLGIVFFGLAIIAMMLQVATIYFLFKPAKIGLYVGLATVLWCVLQNFAATVFIISNLDGAKVAFTASRTARGLSVEPELYDLMFTPVAMMGLLALSVLVNAIVAFLFLLNRRYFSAGDRSPIPLH